MKKTLLYHGGRNEVEFPEIRKTKYTKDFSWGFYCTNNYQQAYKWADRKSIHGYVNIYEYKDYAAFKHPTHQISFHSLKALDCLVFLESEKL